MNLDHRHPAFVVHLIAALACISPASDAEPRRPGRAEEARELDRACGRGNARACLELGERLALGSDGPKNRARAAALFERSCRLGSGRACTQRAGLLADATTAQAEELLDRACSLNDPVGCDERARVERDSAKRSEFRAKATSLYPPACDRGDGEACTALGMDRERWPADWRSRLEREELARSLALLEKACRLGHAFACTEAGRLYDPAVYADNGDADGLSIFTNIARSAGSALALYRRALGLYVQGRTSPACYELTLWYGYGLDWPSDVRDLDACCGDGYQAACLHAGLAFEHGDGVTADPRRARRAYERDCSTGVEASCRALAGTYERGLGGPRKLERAGELYQVACEYGDPGACKALSAMYREGRGVTRSDERAIELARRWTELCKTPPELCVRHPDVCEKRRIQRDCEPS